MQKIDTAKDFSGRPLHRGDTVVTLSDRSTAKISDIASEGEALFVRLRPIYQSYGKGVWHAADHVSWLSSAAPPKRRPEAAAQPKG
jgi:hypothetical protein